MQLHLLATPQREPGWAMANGMTQIKITIETGMVSAFKACCASDCVSMILLIRQFIIGCGPVTASAPKTHTRPLHRKAVEMMIDLLKGVRDKNEEYRDAIPEQFEHTEVRDG